jgi:hypothetical protein
MVWLLPVTFGLSQLTKIPQPDPVDVETVDAKVESGTMK